MCTDWPRRLLVGGNWWLIDRCLCIVIGCCCCRTVAVDLRGYGDSDKPTGIHEYVLDKVVDDVNQLITELGLFIVVFSHVLGTNISVLLGSTVGDF